MLLAEVLLKKKILPNVASNDAFHISFGAVHGIDYILSWNCKHIANAWVEKEVRKVCETLDYQAPIICTPLELLGGK